MKVATFIGGITVICTAICTAVTLTVLANVYPDNKASVTCEDQSILYGESIDLTKIHIKKTPIIYNFFKPSLDVDSSEATIIYNAKMIGIQTAKVDYHGCIGEFNLTIAALKLETPSVQINIGQYANTYDIVVSKVENADFYTLVIDKCINDTHTSDTFTLGTNLTKEVEVANNVTKIKASVIAKSNSDIYNESDIGTAERSLK